MYLKIIIYVSVCFLYIWLVTMCFAIWVHSMYLVHSIDEGISNKKLLIGFSSKWENSTRLYERLGLCPPHHQTFVWPLPCPFLSFVFRVFPTSTLVVCSSPYISFLVFWLFQTLPSGVLHPATVALKPENKTKNRYANVLACRYHFMTLFYQRITWLLQKD